jgi:cyanophycinase
LSFQDSHARGPLALIGGRFESDNEILFQRLKTLCHGRIAVLAMASSYPLEVGQELVEDFRSYGFEAELVPLFWENRESAAYDEAVIDALAAHGSIFFSGGDQSRIVETLIQAGKETPALECIRDCHARGGLIAGTSAGAAIMSGPMILSGTSLNALSAGLSNSAQDPDDFRLGSGLGFFSWGLVDQHFLHRGRIGRLLAASRELGQEMAFGVDENSALIVCGGSG